MAFRPVPFNNESLETTYNTFKTVIDKIINGEPQLPFLTPSGCFVELAWVAMTKYSNITEGEGKIKDYLRR